MVLKSPDSFGLSCVTQNQALSSFSSRNIVAVHFLEAFKLYNLLSKLFPGGKRLVSCVLCVKIGTYLQGRSFEWGQFVMSCEALLCFSAERHKILAQSNILCRHDGTVLLVRVSGNTRISFNRKRWGFIMFLFHRKMKARPLEMFHDIKWRGRRIAKK